MMYSAKIAVWFCFNYGIDLCCNENLLNDICIYLSDKWNAWFTDITENYNFRDYSNCDRMVYEDITEKFGERIDDLQVIVPNSILK